MGEHIMFSIEDGTAKLLGRDHEFREPTPRREQPTCRSQLRTSRRTGGASTDRIQRWRWSPKRLGLERSNILHSTEIHWCSHGYLHKSGCVARKNVSTIIGMWTRIEVCQILGKDSLSSHYCKRQPPKGYVVQGRLTNIQATTKPENVLPDDWTKIRKSVQKRKTRVGNREAQIR